MTQKELIARGNLLAEKYDEATLENSLRNAFAVRDGEERLALQWALKQKTKTSDGFAFTKEQQSKIETKLIV